MKINPACLLVLSIFFFQGCSALNHTEEISALRDLSREQIRLDQYVEKQDKLFLVLFDKVKSGEVSRYQNQKGILKAFGEPLFEDRKEREGAVLTQWLYRKQVEFFNTDKVYLYFDDSGALKSWDIELKE